MIAAISRALVNAAARRFPPGSQVRREWLAELDFLTTQGRPLHALRFAAGLAFVRPAHAPVIGLNMRTVGTALAIIVWPIVLMLTAVVVGVNVVYGQLPVPLWLFLAAMLTIAGAVGWLWGRRSVIAGPVLLAFLLPFSTTTTGIHASIGSDEFVVSAAVWMTALPLVLLVVGRMAQGRRGGVAVAAGFVAWLAVLGIAFTVDFMAGQDSAPAEHAAFGFIYALTGQSFGLLSPSEQLLIRETYFPLPLVIFALYAMCYTGRACRASLLADEVSEPRMLGPHSA